MDTEIGTMSVTDNNNFRGAAEGFCFSICFCRYICSCLSQMDSVLEKIHKGWKGMLF